VACASVRGPETCDSAPLTRGSHGFAVATAAALVLACDSGGGLVAPGVIFVPTPPQVVVEMLKLAQVGPGDVVYDLGSGDGRIPIAAAYLYGARGVGVELDQELLFDAEANRDKYDVSDLVRFYRGDLFRSDIREATVATLYLSPAMNAELLPKLNKELRTGARVVSHAFPIGDAAPSIVYEVEGRKLYLFVVPLRATSEIDRR
jgi:SAM-dependent methyltransferase